jgi:hypothetical protein
LLSQKKKKPNSQLSDLKNGYQQFKTSNFFMKIILEFDRQYIFPKDEIKNIEKSTLTGVMR